MELNSKMTGTTPKTKAKIDDLVTKWLDVDPNPSSKAEILRLQANGEYELLNRKLGKRIAFGTAGLRSSMAPGFAHMNDVTVLQASQGLVQYLVDHEKLGRQLSIVVGYDHRHHSQRFAEITASVALSEGFRVYYLGSVSNLSDESIELSPSKKLAAAVGNETGGDKSYVHTPLIPFAIDYYNASAGVMVTASHNPAQDNGYKVYYGNGCQIIPPHDGGIANAIELKLSSEVKPQYWDVVGNFSNNSNGLLQSIKPEITKKYLEAVQEKLIKDKKIEYNFVFTPMHGVGLEIFDQVCRLFDIVSGVPRTVAKQDVPDPNFSTVQFPNPEEKGALDLAIEEADRANLKLVLACDPDADRFSVAVKARSTGKWTQLTGNEIGFLFAMYVIEELTPQDQLDKTYLVNSTVSSQILGAMASKKGFHFVDTLTGFKWIGNKAIDLKNQGFAVPFGYEEAIGFMFDLVNDKDGVAAAAVWLQLYQRWFVNNDSFDPIDKLEQGYATYGYYKECNGYYKLQDLSLTDKIFDDTIRESYLKSAFPAQIGSLQVLSWRDLTVGYDSTTPDNKPTLPTDPSSQMITATVAPLGANFSDDKIRFTCRGSGTEPKIKIYIEGRSSLGGDRASELARQCWDTLKTEWFQPEKNGLSEVV